jgi:thiamine kinase-like enzyme
MSDPIVDDGQVTTEWLTAKLRAKGVLSTGSVTAVSASSKQATFGSSVWRLEARYTQDAPPDVPKKLFLKVSEPALAPGEFDPQQLLKEAFFYSTVAPMMDAAFTIPCFDTAYSSETGAAHILLQDLSDTHSTVPIPVLNNCERAVDALARLHAFWWDHPRLGKDIGRFPSWEKRQQEWAETEKCTNDFISALGDQIAQPWREVYGLVLPSLPKLFQRHATGKHLTLVHGDAHLGNFLFPKAFEDAPTFLIDWQFWHPTIGGTDLAFLMAVEWETDVRRTLEEPLLRRYYSALFANGVQNYTWEDCWNDYRLSVILVSIFIPVWQWSLFKWAPNFSALERSMTAFKDLACAAFVEKA